QEAALVGVAQVAHEPPAGEAGEHLEGGGEDAVLEPNALAALLVARRLFDALTEFAQQFLEAVLLGRLREVVERPVLAVGLALRDFGRVDGRGWALPLAFLNKFRRDDVLARLAG